MDGKPSVKGAWSGHVNHLNFGEHQPYLWNIKFCTQVGYVPAQECQITLKRGLVRVT